MLADSPIKIAHYVSLHLVKGLERACCEFINFNAYEPSVEHHTILVENHTAPILREYVSTESSSIHAFSPDTLFNKARLPKCVHEWIRKRVFAKIRPNMSLLSSHL